MAAQGTTTVEAKSGYGLSFEAEMKSLEAIREASHQWPGTVVPTLLGAHVIAPEYRDHPEEYVRIICEDMIPTAAKLKLAEFVDVFCERGAFTMEQSQRILRAAVEHNLGVRAHVCQLTPANWPPLLEFHPASLDHMDFVSDEDIAVLAKLDTVATLLPAANYFLGLERFPPARKLIDSGVAVALGHRLQSRHRAHAIHAVRAVRSLHAYEDVAGRGHRRRPPTTARARCVCKAGREVLSRARTPTSPSSMPRIIANWRTGLA